MISAPVTRALAQVLTQVPPGDPSGGRGEEFGKTSPLALVVILVLGLATVLLIRSMNKRLRNVPASFDEPGDAATDSPAEPRAHGGGDDAPGDGGDTAASGGVSAADEQAADQTASAPSSERTTHRGRTDGPPRASSP